MNNLQTNEYRLINLYIKYTSFDRAIYTPLIDLIFSVTCHFGDKWLVIRDNQHSLSVTADLIKTNSCSLICRFDLNFI